MGLREMRTYWRSSLFGFLCAMVTGAGALIAITTERRGLGATLIIGSIAALIAFVAVASKMQKQDQPQ